MTHGVFFPLQVADLSCDGNQRLDLDGAVISNGPSDNTDGTERPKSTEKQSGPSPEEGPQTEPEVSPQKKVIKPPMPPTKEVKPSPAPEVETDGADKKVCIMLYNTQLGFPVSYFPVPLKYCDCF